MYEFTQNKPNDVPEANYYVSMRYKLYYKKNVRLRTHFRDFAQGLTIIINGTIYGYVAVGNRGSIGYGSIRIT
ncbi:hypothetical protein GCM10028807_17000 [Spirosoma daeguense]